MVFIYLPFYLDTLLVFQKVTSGTLDDKIYTNNKKN